MTIDILPDVALLEIFDFCLNAYPRYQEDKRSAAWQAVVHVCQTWRNVVFGSPLRLNLRLYCEPRRTPVREMMVVWPELPISVSDDCNKIRDKEKWVDNIVAVFEHSDRICRLNLKEIQSWHLEKVLAAMQQPFPVLTDLELWSKYGETAQVVSESFLGGSAPQLQTLTLSSILFPGLPKLLLSATRLVRLYLWNIPHSGYISPETMVTCLSVLTRLQTFVVEFESPQSRSDRNSRLPPPQTRTLLPVLTFLEFKGVSEYLEDLVARIDAPRLTDFGTIFFHQLIFDTPQLTQFIRRYMPAFETFDEARLKFSDDNGYISISLYPPVYSFFRSLTFATTCNQSDWQLSFLTQMCSLSFPQDLISAMEHLSIEYRCPSLATPWQDDVEDSQWLEFLHPFTGVKTLYISEEFTPRVAPAMQELVGERVTEVLPALQTLFLRDPSLSRVQDTFGKFLAARQLANLPIVVSRREIDWFED